jgi:glycosyltransferase 2 family protein
MRKHLSTLLKLLVTIGGLAYVIRQVPLSDVHDALTGVRWGWILVTFLLMNISLVVRAYRWHLLLHGLGLPVRFVRLVQLYFVGSFWNIILPSGFGGDFMRVVEVAQDVPANVAAGTVIVDRMMGLMGLFLMALAALPFRPADFPHPLFIVVTLSSLIGLLGGFVLLEGSLIRRFGRWLPPRLSPVGDGPIARVLQAVQGTGWRAIWRALLISLFFNLIQVAWWVASGRSINLSVPASYYLLVVPILSVALLIPSIGGLGLREALAPTLFAGAGLSNEQAIALSVIVFAVTRLSGLMGAPIYIALTLRQNRSGKAKAPNPTPAPPAKSGESGLGSGGR